MDFKTPREVLDAMQQTLSHGIFGYSEVKGDYFDAVHDWFYKYFVLGYEGELDDKDARRRICHRPRR